jgi:hypothetical protein
MLTGNSDDDDADYTEDDYIDILRSVENADQAGEMFTSAAPFDPTFWPLHGSIERLLGYKRMNVELYDLTFDETWAYPEYDASNGAYLDGVCDWSDVTSTSDFPTCTESEICTGHYEDDVLEFGDFLDEDEVYTNWELYEFIHPWNENLPYIYDSYDFDYCEDDGVYFVNDDDETDDDTSTVSASNKAQVVKKTDFKDPQGIRKTKTSKNLPQTHHGKALQGQPHALNRKASQKTAKDLKYLKRKNKTMKRTKRTRPGMLEKMLNKMKDQGMDFKKVIKSKENTNKKSDGPATTAKKASATSSSSSSSNNKKKTTSISTSSTKKGGK